MQQKPNGSDSDFSFAIKRHIGVLSTFGSVFFGCAVYIAVMLLIGGLLEDDLQRMPMIGRIMIKFLRRIGVFKTSENQ